MPKYRPLTPDLMPRFDIGVTFEDHAALRMQRARLSLPHEPIRATLYYMNIDLMNPGYAWERVYLHLAGCVQNLNGGIGKIVLVVAKRRGTKGDRLPGLLFGAGNELVIVDGWHREFPNWTETRHGAITSKTPRFNSLPEWRHAFDEFLKQSSAHIVVDCRTVELGMVPALGSATRRTTNHVEHNAGVPSLAQTRPAVFIEGKPFAVELDRFERDPNARLACIQHFTPKCQICQFDFGKVYPGLGEGCIEVHHLTPLSELREEHQIDPIKDLLPVCCNCHAMLHKRRPPYTPDELRQIIARKDETEDLLDQNDVPF